MTILKRGNSRYWYIQFQVDRRTTIKSSHSTSRKVAEQLEAELRTQAHAERYLGQKRLVTLDQALANFANSKAGTPNHCNLVRNQRTITAIIRGSKGLDQLTSADLEEFKQQRIAAGMKAQTILHSLNMIRSTVKLARKQGYRVPELNFPTMKVGKGRLRYLSSTEEQALLNALDPNRDGQGLRRHETRNPEMQRNLQDCYDLVLLLLDTGARYGEIANLKWSQVDLDHRLIRLWRPKVQNESILFMTDRAFDVLVRRKRLTNCEHVFANRSGGPRGYAAQSIKKAFKRAGVIDCTIHTLRHTHATRLIQNGLSLYEVRSVLGHSDIKTTMRYAHLAQTDVTSKARDVINRLNGGKPI